MIEKYALLHVAEPCVVVTPGEQVKTASPILPEVQSFIDNLLPNEDSQYVLVNALGAGEYWGCFPPGTPVITSVGDKAIEDVQVGDLVLTHLGNWKAVTGIPATVEATQLTELYVKDFSHNNPVLVATPNHEIWVRPLGEQSFEWRRVDQLVDGDVVVLPSSAEPGSYIERTVSRATTVSWSGTCHDLTVQDDSSYTAFGIAVHNSNRNGDHFEEAGLNYVPPGWSGKPEKDKLLAKDWPYGFPTFYQAGVFVHHRNKDHGKRIGDVVFACWNDRMKRVELVCEIQRSRSTAHGGARFWDKLLRGEPFDVSMGSRVPYDLSSIETDWDLYNEALATFDPKKHKYPGQAVLEFHKKLKDKTGKGIPGLCVTTKEYSDFYKRNVNKILPDGRKVFVYNPFPKFFDISGVFIGADKTAKAMMKIAEEHDRSVLREYVEHAALNLGQAARDVRYLHNHPDADKVAPEGSAHHVAASISQRVPSLASNLYFAALPPQLHHTPEELSGRSDLKELFLHGYKPWEHPLKSEKKAEEHDVLRLNQAEQAMADMKDDLQAPPRDLHTRQQFIGGKSLTPEERRRMAMIVLANQMSSQKVAHLHDVVLKHAFLGKSARATKKGEIKKDVVPDQFAGKAVPILNRLERDIPPEVLNILGKQDPADVAATAGSMGIVLRPHEFQRITIVSMGRPDIADDLDRMKGIFPGSDKVQTGPYEGGRFSDLIARMLTPFMEERSALGPMLDKRIVRVMVNGQEVPPNRRTSIDQDPLPKLSAFYNGYRQLLMNTMATAQDNLSTSSDLAKIASMDASLLFTPLSVVYLNKAFVEEIGAGQRGK